MKINRFEEIQGWIKAKELTILIYKTFKSSKDYSFRDQIQKASVSIMNNIAEGFERQTDKEFKQFLYIAKGSSGEVRSMLYLAIELKMISETEFNKMHDLATRTSKILSGFIKTL